MPPDLNPPQLAAVHTLRGPLLVLAGGPGWDPESLPSEVVTPASLGDAMSLAMAAADVSDQPNI